MGARVCVLDIRATSSRKRLRVIMPRLPQKSGDKNRGGKERGSSGETQSKMVHDFVSLAFSGDASLLVMCSKSFCAGVLSQVPACSSNHRFVAANTGGGPEFCVFVYDWFRSRMLCCQSMVRLILFSHLQRSEGRNSAKLFHHVPRLYFRSLAHDCHKGLDQPG